MVYSKGGLSNYNTLLMQLQLLTMAGGHQLHMYNASVVSEPINTFLHNVNFSKL